ncbi:Pimeloyl-ACP methyl ester carboxylesterase [Catalinimonas alkaloidigena]|uniref:Pimeloyl-ACP methyl ester carboxylesterase n=1 Tax=Catalinimonas alkaloidigena TaxID=1075417 RepID=A0A1G9H530_9BACT|nr:alpha/beta hydrolase [Catalinimonas alkaloidigena]SDL08128.1 Pimeloyl-ACP methyl ester carboxylesterase [Catalinimonas alkaloidigena]
MLRSLVFFCSLVLLLAPVCRLGATAPDATGQYFTSFDGTRIYYEVAGSGAPVLLVHGFIVDGTSWKRTALYQQLLDAGFRVIVPDLRGNGQSDKPHTPEAYANDAEARDLMGLMSALGITHYRVVGYSRGSIITARLLALDTRVDRAVLGGMGAAFTKPEWPRREKFYHALMGEDVPELAGMVRHVQEAGLDQRALAYLQKEQPSTPPDVLGRVQQPVLVIAGDQDNDNGIAEELAALFPHARAVRVPGEHNRTYHTEAFAENVLAFLQED